MSCRIECDGPDAKHGRSTPELDHPRSYPPNYREVSSAVLTVSATGAQWDQRETLPVLTTVWDRTSSGPTGRPLVQRTMLGSWRLANWQYFADRRKANNALRNATGGVAFLLKAEAKFTNQHLRPDSVSGELDKQDLEVQLGAVLERLARICEQSFLPPPE